MSFEALSGVVMLLSNALLYDTVVKGLLEKVRSSELFAAREYPELSRTPTLATMLSTQPKVIVVLLLRMCTSSCTVCLSFFAPFVHSRHDASRMRHLKTLSQKGSLRMVSLCKYTVCRGTGLPWFQTYLLTRERPRQTLPIRKHCRRPSLMMVKGKAFKFYQSYGGRLPQGRTFL